MRPAELATRLASLALVFALGGCAPLLGAVSTPPPTRLSQHDFDPFDDDAVKLSRGVAIAFDCVEPWMGQPCRGVTFDVDRPDVVRVMPAHLERRPSPWDQSTRGDALSGFVLVGLEAGEASVTLLSEAGSKTVRVTVVE